MIKIYYGLIILSDNAFVNKLSGGSYGIHGIGEVALFGAFVLRQKNRGRKTEQDFGSRTDFAHCGKLAAAKNLRAAKRAGVAENQFGLPVHFWRIHCPFGRGGRDGNLEKSILPKLQYRRH